MKNLVLILINIAIALIFFLFHHLLPATIWLSLGLALGSVWYLIDPLLLYPRYQKLTELPFPLSRSFWLLIIFWPLAVFILTSTGSWLAQGLMLALGAGIGLELIALFQQPDQIKVAFHFPSQSKWQASELQIVAGGWLLGLLIVMALFVI